MHEKTNLPKLYTQLKEDILMNLKTFKKYIYIPDKIN